MKKLDTFISKVKKYSDPESIKDLDRFLDALPMNAGYNAIIAAGLAWVIAGGAVLFASMEIRAVSELRQELLEVEALKPPVPELAFIPVPQANLEEFVVKAEKIFGTAVNLRVETDGTLNVSSGDLASFAAFRSALGHVVNGGERWNIKIEELCVGEECEPKGLNAILKISAVQVKEAAPPVPTEG